MSWIKRMFGGERARMLRVKVPTILQMEATECGAAALAMILAHYRLWAPLEKLRAECGVNRDGSNASCVLKAARGRGCTAKGVQMTPDAVKKAEYPLIIHWEFNHFVVLEGVKNGRAYLNDPAVGRRTVPWEEFRTSFTGIALKIRPGESFRPEGAPYSVFHAIAKKLRHDRAAVLFVSILTLLMIVPGLAQPVFNQIFLDEILTARHPDWLFNLILAMVCAIGLVGALTALRARVLTRWQKKLTLADSASFFWHTLRLPMQFFEQRYAAEVASRIAFNESVAAVLSNAAATAALDFFVAMFFLLLLLQYSVSLTLIGLGFSAAEIGVFLALRRRITDLNMRVQQEAGKEYGTLMNGVLMIETVKANGAEADLFSKWAGYHAKVLRSAQEIELWSLTASALPAFLAGLNTAVIMTVGGFSIMEGVMTAGIYIAFQHLIANFQSPINKLVTLGTTLQTTEMQLRRLDDVRRYPIDSLNYAADADDAASGVLAKENGAANAVDAAPMPHRLAGALQLSDVSFGYSPLEPPLLEHFDLSLQPGRWVAVVGPSGSGKSTVARIISGLYEEWSGEIRFDGVRRRDVPRSVLTGSVAVVNQDIFFLSGTVQENITLFDVSIRRADVIEAAKDACIHEDILRLDGGYESEVSEGGTNFSGGQRQRLEIARALARNPALLILDEATSALDPVTEMKVLQNIRRRGCSCFIVAHRLSTIRDCDEIIVLERGRVAERGTHREMMQADGAYRRLLRETGAGED